MVLETHRADHAHSVLIFARNIISAMSDKSVSQAGLKFRVGIHKGTVIAGLIGKKRFVYHVWGETVNRAARLEAYGEPGLVMIDDETATALTGKFRIAAKGEVDLKGLGPTRTWVLEGRI